MIATGLLFWTGTRRARHQRQGHSGAHLLDAICVCSCSGLILATLRAMAGRRFGPAATPSAADALAPQIALRSRCRSPPPSSSRRRRHTSISAQVPIFASTFRSALRRSCIIAISD